MTGHPDDIDLSGPGPDEEGAPGGAPLPPECARVEGDLAELALGTLNGKARGAALAHLERCPRCSAEV